MERAAEYDKKNPAFERAALGVEANHSTAEPSVEHTEPHSQSDDPINGRSGDPNIAGRPEMTALPSWEAGPIDPWRENDDYRYYFERSVGCDGMLAVDE